MYTFLRGSCFLCTYLCKVVVLSYSVDTGLVTEPHVDGAGSVNKYIHATFDVGP
jgi:hypothetical protein